MQKVKAFAFIVGRLSDAIEKRESFLCTHRFRSAFFHLRFSIRVLGESECESKTLVLVIVREKGYFLGNGKGNVFLRRQLVFSTNHGYLYIAPVCSGGFLPLFLVRFWSEKKKMLSLFLFSKVFNKIKTIYFCYFLYVQKFEIKRGKEVGLLIKKKVLVYIFN